VFVTVLCGQELVPAGSALERKAAGLFEESASAPALKCAVRTYPPRLSFSFRYWTGYEVAIPVRNLEARSGGRLQVLLRVTPAGGNARYFFQRQPLPRLPEDLRARKRAELFLSGGVVVGTGEYAVALQVSDPSGRVCQNTWRAVAPATKVPLRVGAGEVIDAARERWTGIRQKNSSSRVTIFLHAAPVFPRRTLTKLSSWDMAVLMGSLTSLLDTLPFGRARVIAYSLDNREVVFSDPDFGPDGLTKLQERLEEMNLGIVSVDALRRASPPDVLQQLVETEIENPEKAEAVVFLGPLSRYFKKAPKVWKDYREALPEAYGVAVFPRFGQTGDIIQSMVKAAGGSTVMVYQPSDLAKAVREISKAEAN
jgi:hypothetical protein